MILSRIKQGVK